MSAKKRVPKLRFRGFSGEWDEEKLGYISNITIGEFVIRTKQNPNTLYPVYNGGKSNTGFYNEFNNTGNKIIISARGANAGYVNFEKRNYWAGNSCYSISMIDEKIFFINYFYYFIKKYEYKFKDNQQSANIPSVSKDDAEKFKVKFPKFKEQTKIGNYFQNLDKLIEQKEKKYQKLGQLKKAILEKMFPKEGATTPEIRFKGFSGEWEEKGLDSISEQISYGLTVRPKYIEVGIPLISARELKNGNINYNLAPKISIKSYNELSEKAKARKGDIFLTKTGTVGLSAYVRENFPIAITQNIAVIRVVNKQYNHQFILQTFKTQNFYKKSISQVNQSTIMDLQLQDIRKLLISFPNKQEQTKIANSLQKLDNLIDLQNQELQKLKNIKKASLAKMFV